jgi:hypothetical protein
METTLLSVAYSGAKIIAEIKFSNKFWLLFGFEENLWNYLFCKFIVEV